MDTSKYRYDDDGIPEDVSLSLRKLFVLVNHQIKYYKTEMEQHENNAQFYLLGKPDETYKELMSKKEEWQWLKQHLIDRWDTLAIN